MKLRLNKSLRRALLMSMLAIASVSSSSLADVYVCAEGVNYESITDSERFYDHAKGWSIWAYSDARETVNKKYQETGSFEFLGELADRLPEGITSVTYDSFSELNNDSMLCWAFAATNQIEYWQSYYGVLYTGDRELPYGYTYNPKELTDLRGVLSLKVGMLFYDNWKDLGGWGSHAFEWYFNGNDTYSELITTGNGGFWKGQITSIYRGFSTSASMDSIKSTLLESLGYQKNSAGDYEATEIGRISQLSIRYYNSTSGHAITCYGLVLDDDGALKGIMVADSDNSQYGLTTYYLKKNDEGYAFLYTDEECTRMHGRYYLEGTYYFKTSSALKEALSSYYDAETPLVWTGDSEVWVSNATLEKLPDEESGWAVTVGNETYHSFFHDNRKVKFSDNASATDVQIVGNLQVSELLLENSQCSYSFVNKGNASISANLISASGAGTAVLSGLDITSNRVSSSGYHLILGSGTLLTTQSLELGNYSILGLSGVVLNAEQMTLGADSRLEIIDGGNVLELGILNFDSSATLYIGADLSSTPILTLSGSSVGNGTLEVLFSDQLTLTEGSYTLFQLEGDSSIWQDVFTSSQGDFEISNGILYFNPARILTWTSGDGIWSSSTWDGESEETNAKALAINKNGNLKITIQGLVTADSLTVGNEEGVVSLESADAASTIGGDLSIIKKNGGTLVLSGANTFCGGISLMGGVLEAGHGQAFGTGDVFVSGGTVKMNGYACPNLLNISDDASLMGGGAYAGQLYLRKGNLTGDALNLDNNAMVMSGSISNVLMGDGGVIKAENGVVTLRGANSYTGGTLITAGELIAMHDSALGRGNVSIENAKLTIGAARVSNSISVSGNSYISVASGTVWNVASPIENSGSLTLSGSIQADALLLTTISSGRVDAYGKYGNNGFAVNAAHSYFVLVDGGKNQTSGLTLTHSGTVYTLKENGVAISGDGNYIDYATYQANAEHTVRISEAQQAAGGLLKSIQLRGGVLYADSDINNVNAQGGTIYLEGGEMKGYLPSATVYATGGTMAASMSNATSFTASGNVVLDSSANNSHTGGTFLNGGNFKICHPNFFGNGVITTTGETTMNSLVENFEGLSNKAANIRYVIQNSGTLTMLGVFNASALPLITTDNQYVDAHGETGESGFLLSAGSCVKLVEGGSLIADATVIHGNLTLVLNNDGYAYENNQLSEYKRYFLNGNDSVRVSTAMAYSSGKLEDIIMTGGTLYADESIKVSTTGGLVELSDGTLSGTIANARVNATGGELAAALSGSTSVHATQGTLTLSGANTHTGINSFKDGTFRFTNASALGAGIVETSGNTTLQADSRVTLTASIKNSGALTILGEMNFSSDVPIVYNYQTYLDIDNQVGTSGFLVEIPRMVRIAEGGDVYVDKNNTKLFHNGSRIYHWKDGMAYISTMAIHSSTYVLNSGDSVRASEAIASVDELFFAVTFREMEVNGGMLESDADIMVNGKGGTIHLTTGDLSGVIQDTILLTEAGTLSATLRGTTSLESTGTLILGGDNTHTGDNVFTDATITLNHANALGFGNITTAGNTSLIISEKLNLHHVISNSGRLEVIGCIDASNLEVLDSTWQYRDVNGGIGNSGFVEQVGARIQVVDGGTVLGNAQVLFGDTSFVLGNDGYAVSSEENNVIAYDKYYLNGTDSVSVSEAEVASSNALTTVCMTGGTLYADASIRLEASGGSVVLSGGTLSGTIGDALVTAEGGVLSAGLSGSSRLSAGGTVTISGANTHTGGTVFNGGSFTLGHASALGTGSIMTQGANTLNATTTVQLSSTILNSGSLTLNGTFDVSALTLITQDATYVDAAGNTGTSGFRKESGYQVQVVNGGTVSGNATIKHGSRSLSLGSDGYATSGGGVSYATYYLNGGDSVSVSAAEAASANALTSVNMSGGSLYADASTRVTSTGGHILLSSGSLSGSVKNADVAATGGTLSAVLSGTSSLSAGGAVTISGANTHTGGTVFNGGSFTLGHASALGTGSIMTQGANTLNATTTVQLSSTILNSGSLTLNGTFDVSALSLITQDATYVDAAGNTGTSGFRKASGYQVQVVNGGTVSGNATIKHGSRSLSLGSDGYATSGGGVSYSTYYLNSGDSVSVSAAEAASATALTAVSMSGGSLYADASTRVTSTGGHILLSSGSLSGSVKNADVAATGGTLSAVLSGTSSLSASGTVTISGANTHTGGTVFNGGSFTLGHAYALGSGSIMTQGTNTLSATTPVRLSRAILNSGTLTLNGVFDVSALTLTTQSATYVDAAGNTGTSGFRKAGGYQVQVVNGGAVSGSATITHGSNTLTLGSDGYAAMGGEVDYHAYYLQGTDSVSVSAAMAASAGALTSVSMSGGTLHVDDSMMVKATGGQIQLTSGTLSGSVSSEASISASRGGRIASANTHTGGTVFNGGSFALAHAAALGNGAVVTMGTTALETETTVALKSEILNSGELSLSGVFDVSSLALNAFDVSYVDAAGNAGSSGFAKAAGYSVQVVNGGSVSGNATFRHGSHTLTLGSDGLAVLGGGVAYDTYYLNSGDVVSASAARKASADALSSISMSGGNLYADTSIVVNATGGQIQLSNGTLSGSARNATITAREGTISAELGGTSRLLVQGNVKVSGNNTYTGGTVLNEGVLEMTHAHALGTGNVTLVDGRLRNSGSAPTNITAGTVTLKGSVLEGLFTLDGSSSWDVRSNTEIQGSLNLEGGLLQLHNSALNVSDTLVLGNATIELDASYVEGNTYTLLSAGNISGSVFALELQGASSLHCLKVEDNALVLRYMSEVAPTGSALQGGNLTKDDKVVIEEAGSIVLEGAVAPGAITVAADKNVTLASNKKAPGSLTGDGNLSKSGGGTLTLNEDNSSWTGDTCLNGGGIKVKGDNSLGQGDVYVENGTLDLSSKAVGNDIVQTGTGVIKGGKKFTGTYTLEEGAELMKGSTLDIATSATLSGGVVSGSLSGSGQVNVTGEVILSDNGKISTNGLSVNETGSLTVSAKGLSLNAKTSTLTLDGGSIVTQGKLSGCELDISNGGSLVTSSAKPVALSFKGDFEASGLRDEDGEIIRKSTISIYGGFTASSLTLTDSDFRLEMNSGMRSVSAPPKAQSVTINGKGTDSCLDAAEMVVAGKMSVTGNLKLKNDSSLKLYDPSGKNAAMPLAVKGTFDMNSESELSLNGKLSAASLNMKDADITLSNEKAQSIALTMAKDAQKRAVNNTLNNSRITANASMSVAGNLELSGASSIHLWDANTAKPKALNLAVKGNLTVGSGSSLTLSGALSAANLTLDGGSINLTGTKPQTIKVSNQLAINSGTDINFNFTVTAKDANKKVFKILTFKTIGEYVDGDFVAWTDEDKTTSDSLLKLLGLQDAGCTLTLDVKKKNISLTVNDLEAWEAAKEDGEDDAASEETPTPTALAALPVVPDFSPVADALVQANWGQVEASCAFVNAIGSRSMAVQLGSGERAVWASAIGASSRHSAAGGHNGADTNVTGGALGVETQLGESSLLGVALGSSRTRVSAHNYGTIKQDTTHLGLYGQTGWNKLSADWSAAYGRSDSEIHDSSWKQNHLQLDGRVSYNHALSSSTVLRGFGGMQYYASDSATVDGIETGSIQNLRAEIGVGASHAIGKLGVYGEVAVHQDLVRHNPTVTTPDARYRGMNPGRTGLNFTVGASYSLTDQWSVNASYTGEIVENANAHSANVGATYKF